ncbi:hypothetical protein GCM10023206_11960 [Acinetobacter puyangensis]|uniref:Cell division protein ZapA n=1 Tax=Acinetobacter puyangensis TaxID=1096779 RepID=A0A240EB47_9GAMM|nr:cell division protein ZapA [Acinetobacter puyangensis]SNX45493.1 Cell division protein ZapA, inhibits GTPase activity of FtsZ [Acinetobacter puyangensis]
MSNIAAVELWLLDSTYKLGCPVDKQDELKGAGELLEQKFREMRAANPRMDNQKIAVMVALQLMQDVVELNKSLQSYSQCEHVLGDIIDDLDQQLKNIG